MDGASSNPAQKDLLRVLFHWTLVRRWTPPTNGPTVSTPAVYPRLPLFSLDGPTRYLNQVFVLVYDDATTLQSMPFDHRPEVEGIDCHGGSCGVSVRCAIPEASLPACPKIS